MDTKLSALFLLPIAAMSLPAQAPRLDAQLERDRLTAVVHNAPAGSLVVLVLGAADAAIQLPGGAVLEVTPDLLLGPRRANASGAVEFALEVHGASSLRSGLAIEAVAIDPRQPDPVRAVQVSATVHLAAAR